MISSWAQKCPWGSDLITQLPNFQDIEIGYGDEHAQHRLVQRLVKGGAYQHSLAQGLVNGGACCHRLAQGLVKEGSILAQTGSVKANPTLLE